MRTEGGEMLKRIIDFSLDHQALVICGWIIIAALGVDALRQLPIDAVPDVTNVQVQVITSTPGLAPEEVEQVVTFPVEVAMSGIPSVDQVRSVSKFGLSVVTVVFDEGVDIYWARQLISERLTEAREEIPDGAGVPKMGPTSTGLGEVFQFEVHGEPMCGETEETDRCYTPMELRSILDWSVAFQLRSVPGVVEVVAFGGELKTYQVTLDSDRLNARSIGAIDVEEALKASNRNAGGGYFERGGEQVLVRGEGLLKDLDDIADVVIKTDINGHPIRVRDVATVELAPMIRQGAVTRDGKGETVIGIVMMLQGENARVVVDDVKERMALIEKSLPAGVSIKPFYDRTVLVERTIKTVAMNLLEGGVLVILVLLLLLGNIRGGLIVALSIPLSMLVAFIGMRAAGLSGNLMSLGAIDFGLIVDGSVVMVENIVRRLHQEQDAPSLSRTDSVRAAAHQVARPVVFAVGIIMIVYMPILGLRGVEGKMFIPMALTIVFALAGSLLCALTLMPVLARLLLGHLVEKDPWLFRLARRLYLPSVAAAMRRPFATAMIAGGVFVASLTAIPFLGAEFIPRLDEGTIAMQVVRLPSVSLEQSNAISTAVEAELLKAFPEVSSVVSKTGRPEIATDPMGVELSDAFVDLHPRSLWRFSTKEKLVDAMREHLERTVPAAAFSFSQPIELRVAELISGVRSDVAVHIYGDDLAKLKEVADEVAEVVGNVAGAAETKAEQTTGLPILRVELDREKMARYGIRTEDALAVVESIGGRRVGTMIEGQRRFALQMRFDESTRRQPEAIEKLRVFGSASGANASGIPLGQIADVAVEVGPAQISRERISRRINVEANVRGRDLASFVAEAKRAVEEKVAIPDGWTVEWGGQFKNLESANARLSVLVPLALLFIFVLLFTAFGGLRQTLLVFLNVPLAASGGLLALALRGYPLSISAGVGFIALFGVAVLNGVVLLTTVEAYRQQGESPDAAAEKGAALRLRPVLMTALVASLGFVPMALATGAGAEVQRPLATVVIGGLVTSTLLTLVVLPALYARVIKAFKQEA